MNKGYTSPFGKTHKKYSEEVKLSKAKKIDLGMVDEMHLATNQVDKLVEALHFDAISLTGGAGGTAKKVSELYQQWKDIASEAQSLRKENEKNSARHNKMVEQKRKAEEALKNLDKVMNETRKQTQELGLTLRDVPGWSNADDIRDGARNIVNAIELKDAESTIMNSFSMIDKIS